MAIPRSGALEDTPLPKLLLTLSRARFDGTLRVRREAHEKSFRFQRGAPISAESNQASDTLGLQLLDSGHISRDDYHRVSSHVIERDVKEGVALLELRLIEPKELFVALKDQVRARLVDCFGWPRAHFETEAQPPSSGDAQPFRADVVALIQEGLEVHWDAERILADLAPRMNHTARRNRQLSRVQDRLRSDESVLELIDALDGSCTLWRALQKARTPRAMAAAWLLHEIQAIDYSDAGDPDAPPEIEIVFDRPGSASQPQAETTERDEAPTPELDDVLAVEISQKYLGLDELDHYELLGLPQDAAPAEIKRAYLDAAKRYHPDALARAQLDGDTRQKAGKVFGAIGKAHAVLSNPKRRQDYDASLDSDDTDLDAERLAAAETNYRKGEILMRQGNFRGALEYLKPAVELWPDDAAYQSALGWSLYKATPSDPVRARQHLESAYGLEPRNAETAYQLALVLKTLGETAPAANLMAKARSLDPDIG